MSANAFAYMRCSGQGQIDGDTWDRQEAAIKRFADATGHNVLLWFRDEGVSGKTELIGRDGLTACIEQCRHHGIKTVIVESADRLARDMIVSELLVLEFQKIGVTIMAASGGVNLTEGDDSNPTAKLVRQILSAVAEFDRNSTVIKLRVARERMRAKTGRCEGQKPYGHTPEESLTLARIRDLRAIGMPCHAIASQLATDGILTRSGAAWHPSTIAKILTRTS